MPRLTYTPLYLAEEILTACSALEGERKQVMVLFADLKGATELIRDLAPEAANTSSIGPPAHDGGRASLRGYGEPGPWGWHHDLHMDYSAVGQTTPLAARLEQLATPGSLRLTAATLRLTEAW